ncbi:hypothetical protein EXX76_16770, partial [Escherichia coli]|uniref:YicS family protein n=1 Tax=Escherichia coli TaxID=562 RepID=UPI0010F132C8
MKPTTLLLIFTFFAMPGIVYAESPFSSLQSAKEKTTVLQDLRKICTPQASLSDEAWENGFAPIFPDICYHLTHYRPAAADIPV